MSISYRIITNTFWATLARLAYRLSNSIIAIIISRMLGVAATGTYNTALTYYTIGLSFAVWGFDQILILEVSKNNKLIYKYFGNLIIFQSLFGFLTMGIVAALSFLTPYPNETQYLIRIFSISIFAESINMLCQAVFMCFEKVKGISVLNTTLAIIKVFAIFFAVNQKMGLVTVVWIFTIISLLAMISFLFLVREYIPKPGFKVDWKFGINLLQNSFVIFLISALFTIDNRVDVLTLSIISTEYMVGLYTSAFNIVTFFYLFPQAFRDVVYPTLSKLHHSDSQKTQLLYNISTKYLLLFTLPMAMGISVLSPEIITIIYNKAFEPASLYLSIGVWMFPIFSVMVFNSRLLVIAYKGKQVVKYFLLSSILLLILNLLLYPRFGILASSIIRVSSGLFVLLSITRIVSRTLYKFDIKKIMLQLIFSLVVMGFIVYIIKEINIILSIISGGLIYLILVYLLNIVNNEDLHYWKTILVNLQNRN